MKAIVTTKHGSADGLRLQEVEQPAPKENEVLIKVHAGTVTQGDVMIRKLHPLLFLPMRLFGLKRKKTPGHELAGEIVAAGSEVTRFKIGDQVFGTTTGLSVGANAEYVALPEEWTEGVLAIKPANVSYAEAAAVPVGGMTALYLLRKGNIKRGQDVLIYGASGSVGSYAVQIASALGATVTGVSSPRNIELVKSLGADKTIDYKTEDFRENGETYDLIFDAVGKISASESKGSLKENGSYVSVQISTSESQGNLLFLRKLVETGKIKPVIDRCFPLAQTAEAHRYVETGRKRGNVVITVNNDVSTAPASPITETINTAPGA